MFSHNSITATSTMSTKGTAGRRSCSAGNAPSPNDPLPAAIARQVVAQMRPWEIQDPAHRAQHYDAYLERMSIQAQQQTTVWEMARFYEQAQRAGRRIILQDERGAHA